MPQTKTDQTHQYQDLNILTFPGVVPREERPQFDLLKSPRQEMMKRIVEADLTTDQKIFQLERLFHEQVRDVIFGIAEYDRAMRGEAE